MILRISEGRRHIGVARLLLLVRRALLMLSDMLGVPSMRTGELSAGVGSAVAPGIIDSNSTRNRLDHRGGMNTFKEKPVSIANLADTC